MFRFFLSSLSVLIMLSLVYLSWFVGEMTIKIEYRKNPDRSLTKPVQAIPSATKTSKTQLPHLFLHVGPQKTASTYIQGNSDKLQSQGIFAKDNYQYYGAHVGPSSMQMIYDDQCHKNVTDMLLFPQDCNESTAFGSLLKRHYDSGTNLFISQEHLWSRISNANAGGVFDTVFKAHGQHWDVSVLFVYRRIFDIIPSEYSQLNKVEINTRGADLWPDQGGAEAITTIADFITRKHTWLQANASYTRYTSALTRFAERFGLNMTILNYYGDRDILERLVCSFMPAAKQTCAHLINHPRETKPNSPPSQGSREFDYDRLAVYAYQHGYLTGKNLGRIEVANRIQNHLASQNLTVKNLPQLCFDDDMLFDTLFWSKKYDQYMLGELSLVDGADGERQFESDFQARVDAKTYCSTDVEKVLTDRAWKEFFLQMQ